MNVPLSFEDISAMEHQLRDSLNDERKRKQINDVKCDAIHTAKTYEEFADRVAAAHLQPLVKKDRKDKTDKAWNQYATKEKDYGE